MAKIELLEQRLAQGAYSNTFQLLYGKNQEENQRARYQAVLGSFRKTFPGTEDVELFSAPGRTELGGNHTDHQHGCVVAASVDLDVVAAAGVNGEQVIRILSEGYPMVQVSLDSLSMVEEEKNTTNALIRGVAAGMRERGYQVGGFDAYVTSNVLQGSGLSSSAAFEVMVGTLVSYLFNQGQIDPVAVAQVGQYAENVYFGKPCGLLDQMACAVGGYVAIDFYNPQKPVVEKIEFNFSKTGHTMCIVDAGGSHADLTDDYAAITREMKQVAACFGKEVLRQVPPVEFYTALGSLRSKVEDRALLRAIHFFEENTRAQEMAHALRQKDFEGFRRVSLASGRSSFMYLQNVFTCKSPTEQKVSLALAVADVLLQGRGCFRIQGGGFAGTIQAFVPNDMVAGFKEKIEAVTGKGTCHLLSIRPVGGIKVEEEAVWQN